MKYLYLFIIASGFGFFGFSQTSYVQIELVNPLIGEPTYIGNDVPVSTSTDDGLNTIFSLHGISFYESIHPGTESGFSDNGATLYTRVRCDNCNESNLISDLLAYDTVVAYAALDTDFYLVNGLYVSIVNEAVGIATGVNSDGVIETNDTVLNQLFIDNNVVNFELDNSEFTTSFSLKCRCDATVLKTELDNYDLVIASTAFVSYGILLSIEDNMIFEAEIYPQPFNDKVNISVNQPIENLVLYDILGKRVYKTSSVSDFENFSSNLKSGVYLLKLRTVEGEEMTKKLVKS